ncbi:hypothetical protein [uncultured Phascolarctobacterium sp.]|uniref:hypothetical protein n=1 Tax=uncultured Phascolarctobacterium sp. TaxID=512296 RepID=UPI0026327A1B|nr:hypothetical protein [uncultured Phascolarctobacterium sp.]
MNEVELTFKVVNPGALLKNHEMQRQLASWLVEFGIKQGTIKNPYLRGDNNGKTEKKVLHVQRGYDANAKEACAM